MVSEGVLERVVNFGDALACVDSVSRKQKISRSIFVGIRRNLVGFLIL